MPGCGCIAFQPTNDALTARTSRNFAAILLNQMCSRRTDTLENRDMRLLLVEDEPEMAAALSVALGRYDMILDHAPSLDHAIAAMANQVHDAVILDRQLRDGDGLTLIPRVRALKSGIPVIVLTARGAVDERVKGLDMGADDYLAKPFAVEELLARLRALIRHAPDIAPTRSSMRAA